MPIEAGCSSRRDRRRTSPSRPGPRGPILLLLVIPGRAGSRTAIARAVSQLHRLSADTLLALGGFEVAVSRMCLESRVQSRHEPQPLEGGLSYLQLREVVPVGNYELAIANRASPSVAQEAGEGTLLLSTATRSSVSSSAGPQPANRQPLHNASSCVTRLSPIDSLHTNPPKHRTQRHGKLITVRRSLPRTSR